MEEDLARLDELELREMLAVAEAQIAAGQTVSHREVKERTTQRMNAATTTLDRQTNELAATDRSIKLPPIPPPPS